MRNDADRQTFLQLVEKADVLIENFRPGTMESFNLAPAMLMELNPRLIYASATGFGRTGALGKRPAYDIIIQAMSGLMSITGIDPQQPVRAGTSISDLLAGLFTTIGIPSRRALRATVMSRDAEPIWTWRCSIAPWPRSKTPSAATI